MAKQVYGFNDFLENSNAEHADFFNEINDLLIKNGYEPKVDLKKTGFFVSYIRKTPRRTIINYATRKRGTYIRIYGDNTEEYMDLFNSIPQSMTSEILKANDCKRMIDPNACNPKCKMGITIDINGDILGKCRNSAMMFLIQAEKYPFIMDILKGEIDAQQ